MPALPVAAYTACKGPMPLLPCLPLLPLPMPAHLSGCRGRAEPIKLALAAKGIEFDVQPVGASACGRPAGRLPCVAWPQHARTLSRLLPLNMLSVMHATCKPAKLPG